MNLPRSHFAGGDHRGGAALIIVLCFVVLLTVLILAFLNHSQTTMQIINARSAGVQVDVMARTAIELTKADLRQEIVAGSKEDGNPAGASYTMGGAGPRIYVPTSHFTAAPSVTGFSMGAVGADPLANVLKISRSDAAFFAANRSGESATDYDTTTYPSPAPPGGASLSWASAVNTSQPSLNGRYLDWSVWETSQLIETSKGTPSASSLPQWIYLTSTGSPRKVITTPDSTVIGRYAYVIYDEGGLLDINNAGYPSTNSFSATLAVSALDAARKGPMALADLTQIPGITSATMEDSIVRWRNQATTSTTSAAEFPAGNFTYPTNSQPPFLQYAFNSSFNNGFTSIYPQDSTSGNPGDQRFLSRQDLIAYSAANPTVIPASSLPYLGTFTRANNAPTYSPAATIGSPTGCTYDYAGNAEVTTASASAPYVYNRDIANVRWQNAVTVTRPVLNDDTGIATETVTFNKGDPLIQHRFPLSKLQLLANPTAANAAAILYYFGLKYFPNGDSTLSNYTAGFNAARTEPCWEYMHATATLTGRPSENAGQYKYLNSLQEVASLTGTSAREPDFFELLQAGILSGSDVYDMLYNIGISIIGQATPENAVGTLALPAASGNVHTYFAPRNLPYISQLLFWPYRPNPGDATYKRSIFEAYLVPVIWNPHRNATTASTVNTNLQISLVSTKGATISAVLQPFSAYATYGTSPGLSDQNPPTPIAFNNSSIFSEPTILNPTSVTITSPAPSGSLALSETPANRWGFYLGQVVLPDTALSTQLGVPNPTLPNGLSSWPGNTHIASIATTAAGGAAAIVDFAMQYLDSSNNPHTYQYLVSGGNRADCTTTALPAGGATIGGNLDYSTISFSGSSGSPSDGHDYFGPSSWGPLDPRINTMNVQNTTTIPNGRVNTQEWNTSLGGTMASPIGATWRPAASVAVQTGLPGLVSGMAGILFGTPTPPVSCYAAQYCENSSVTGETLQYADSAYITSTINGDGMIRPGDAYRPGAPSPSVSYPLAANQTGDRPLILNRPFRNVGELGYAFRALEWKTLDFSSPQSADAGLLDLFSVQEKPVVNGVSLVSGVVDLNTRNPEVLQALLSGELVNDLDTTVATSSTISSANTANTPKTIATAIVTETTSNGPLLNRADIATRLAPLAATTFTRKTERESVVRALAEPANTRTWNLLIDLDVQMGRYPTSTLTAGASALANFDVQGEKRYWLHVAIDRYTGQILDEQLEAVTDN